MLLQVWRRFRRESIRHVFYFSEKTVHTLLPVIRSLGLHLRTKRPQQGTQGLLPK